MKPLRVSGATRYLGAPPGWKDEGKPCGYLAIRDEKTTVGPAMTSAWELEPHEVEAVTKGAPVYLMICGVVHPPVSIKVGMPPESYTEENCPGHVASLHDLKICGRCGIHIDSLR